MHTPLLLVIVQTVGVSISAATADTAALEPDSAELATAYTDDRTRELVRLARGRRGAIESSVFHYTATARQRLSVGIRGPVRDRVLFRREVASRLEWWRHRPGRVEVLGAREATPVARGGVRVPDDVQDWAGTFVPRPGDDRLWVNPTGGGFAWHPLIEGGEALYRYDTGDSTLVRLPDGREVRLVELLVTPRRRDIRLVTGSFWIELDHHAVVQAVFRPASDFDIERDLPTVDPDSEDDTEDVPAFLRPIRFETRYITVEYALWELRWWMPRLMAFQGTVQVGVVRMPITMELLYTDYAVEDDPLGLPELPPVTMQLAGVLGAPARDYRPPMIVTQPEDSLSLLRSDYLAASFFDPDETLISEAELRDLAHQVGAIPPPPWQAARPSLTPPWDLRHRLVRYNRVEGLSVGARADLDLGRARIDLTARTATADLAPKVELGVELPRAYRDWRLAAYRRLVSADPAVRPFSLANSLGALLFGRDDGEYFLATGAEAELLPAASGRRALRVYAERQSRMDRTTDASVAHVLDGTGFRENLQADAADQVGIAVRAGKEPSADATGWRWSALAVATAETGTFTFVRPGLTLRGWAPLPGSLVGALEIAGGTVLAAGPAARAPAQSLWFLGGAPTLRGFAAGRFTGPDYVRARAEVATELPAARISLFADAGWAGRADAWDPSMAGVSVGVGGSLLDGLIRADLARTVQPVRQWRLDIYLDALL